MSFVAKRLSLFVVGIPLLILVIYGFGAWLFMRALPIDYLVAASLDGTAFVPRSIIYTYVTHSSEVRDKIRATDIPLIGVTINSVSKDGIKDSARFSDACSLMTLELQNGQDINARLPGGFTPLLSAVLLNQPELVKFVLTSGANTQLVLSRKSAQGVTIEMNALQYAQDLQEKNPKIDRLEVIKILLGTK